MATRTYDLTLSGLDAPDGQIDFRDIAALADSLQVAATRISRLVAGLDGRGRAPAGLDAACSLRLVSLNPGSTAVKFALGDEASLAGMTDEEQIATKFEELVRGVAENAPPEWVTPLISLAAAKLATGLQETGASEFSMVRDDIAARPTVARSSIPALDRAVWKIEAESPPEMLTVSGLLEAVDLRYRRFLVRDDVGNDIRIEDVADLDSASRLIGSRVVATGMSERDERGRVRLVGPTVTIENLPEHWLARPVDAPVAGAPLDEIPKIDVSADEIDAFLAEIRT